ncbi:MAG: ATPase [Magnetococcales bacterium]|nr:ATPase [Magnetococcales bacterium]
MIISRPKPARWFRLVVTRDDLPRSVALLAARRAVELEADGREMHPTLLPELAPLLDRFEHLSDRFRPYWPAAENRGSDPLLNNPRTLMAQAVAALEGWQGKAEPLVMAHQARGAEALELKLLEEWLIAMGEGSLDLSLLRRGMGAQGVLESGLFLLPTGGEELEVEPEVMVHGVTTRQHHFWAAVAPREAMARLSDQVVAAKGRPLTLPDWLRGLPHEALTELEKRALAARHQLADLERQLKALGEQYRIPEYLGAVAELQWFYATVEKVSGSGHFALVTGWTDRDDEAVLNRALEKAGVRGLLGFSAQPPGEPPLVLANPWWAKPFEIFPKLLGTPGGQEADPSPILAILAPLLFGYMFGDVGQGAVLLGLGWYLREKKLPGGALLVSGGAMAIVFGFLFGSIFCREDIMPPLWLHPTAHPLEVLGTPMLLGALVILTGLALNGLGASWRGQQDKWLKKDVGEVLLYLGLLTTIVHPAGPWIAGAGVVWYLLGGQRLKPGVMTLLTGLGHLLETGLQLMINTLSFSRVGAFALAHAGLSQAVLTLSDVVGGGVAGLVVLILGNLLILVLEGLVVSVQTTRLVLFEFFVRFLTGDGRPFKPLSPPPGYESVP